MGTLFELMQILLTGPPMGSLLVYLLHSDTLSLGSWCIRDRVSGDNEVAQIGSLNGEAQLQPSGRLDF